ncbi:hypothetical protein Tco_1050445 [Tanacetum coccineum]
MASESSSQSQQPKQLTPTQNVHFEVEDGTINFNNGIALLESKNTSYHPMLQFLSKSFISAALTDQPSAYYPKYLREFWYTAQADTAMKPITITLSYLDKPLSFNLDVFTTVIGLEQHPLGEAYTNENLKTLKPHYITALSFKPTKTALTAHMCKVAELSPDPIKSLLPPFGEVNANDSTDKSSFGTFMQSVIQPKVPTDLKPKKKRIPPSSTPKSSKQVRDVPQKKQVVETQPAEETVAIADATQSLGAFDLAEDQVNQPQIVDTERSMYELNFTQTQWSTKPISKES